MQEPPCPVDAGSIALAHCGQLVELFDALFAASENTRLAGGGEEPLYQPAGAGAPQALIVFRADYVRSALHEVAHWCIAGRARRREVDYGYWYSPDGRDADAQREFERLEARPQAVEWMLSAACGVPFRPSLDNLGGEVPDPLPFMQAICREAARCCREGLPPRAERFRAALAARFGGVAPRAEDFELARLQSGAP